MSRYLIRDIETAPNIDVRYRTELVGAGGDGHLERLTLRYEETGDTETAPADGLFVLIGGQPFTEWLPEGVGRDQWGFILTGPDAAERGAARRAPLLLETSTPGVFAAGDVRHGSVKRVASAVGDGAIAIRLVQEYLASRNPAPAATT
jgi:thioredoxin reductase (NADPH)